MIACTWTIGIGCLSINYSEYHVSLRYLPVLAILPRPPDETQLAMEGSIVSNTVTAPNTAAEMIEAYRGNKFPDARANLLPVQPWESAAIRSTSLLHRFIPKKTSLTQRNKLATEATCKLTVVLQNGTHGNPGFAFALKHNNKFLPCCRLC